MFRISRRRRRRPEAYHSFFSSEMICPTRVRFAIVRMHLPLHHSTMYMPRQTHYHTFQPDVCSLAPRPAANPDQEANLNHGEAAHHVCYNGRSRPRVHHRGLRETRDRHIVPTNFAEHVVDFVSCHALRLTMPLVKGRLYSVLLEVRRADDADGIFFGRKRASRHDCSG